MGRDGVGRAGALGWDGGPWAGLAWLWAGMGGAFGLGWLGYGEGSGWYGVGMGGGMGRYGFGMVPPTLAPSFSPDAAGKTFSNAPPVYV